MRIDGEGPVIDGRADDAIWERALPASRFVQQRPDEGQPATERTEVSRSGTGFFLVYNDERDTFGPRDSVLGRALIVKYTRQFDF